MRTAFAPAFTEGVVRITFSPAGDTPEVHELLLSEFLEGTLELERRLQVMPPYGMEVLHHTPILGDYSRCPSA